MQNNMTQGKILPIILKFTLPLLIGNMFQQLYNMADTIIVGHFIGQDALAAVGSTGTIMFLVLGFATGMSTGFTVLTSQKFGAGDEKATRCSVTNAILLSAVLSVILTLLSVSLMKPLLHLMNTPAAIFQDAWIYISVICLGTVCSVFYNLFSAFLRAVGNSRIPLVFLVLSAVLNVVLDLVFIINLQMGVAGAAWATDLSQGISAVLCLIYIYRKVPALRPRREDWKPQWNYCTHQLSVGLPMALQFAITASGTIVMQSAINLFDTVAVAGVTAASKAQNLATQGMVAMGQTMSAFAGQNYGKGELGRIRDGVRYALLTDIVYSLVSSAFVVLTLPHLIALFFSANVDLGAMLPWAKTYIYQCAVFYIPLSFIFVFRNVMQGCGYSLMPMLGGVVEFFARLGAAVLAMNLHNFNLAAGCDPVAWVAACLFTWAGWLWVRRDIERRGFCKSV